jgi:hypothetical protein
MTAVALEDGRWVVASIPAFGEVGALLARQAEVGAPVKVVAPAAWRAEMPDCAGAEEVVRAALRAATEPAPQTAGPGAEALAAALLESAMPWVSGPGGAVLRVEAPGATCSIAASLGEGGSVFFRAPLLRRTVPPEVRDVMTHFILALNARLRLARASWTDAGVTLEVALPAAALNAFLVEEAVEALAAGFRLARRECASLLDGRVAAEYRRFHLSKGEQA